MNRRIALFRIAYIAVAAVLFAFTVLPLVNLWIEFPEERTTYLECYPALFLFSFPFFPLIVFFLYHPVKEYLFHSSSIRGRSALMIVLGFLFAAAAVYSEWNKKWLSPWEIGLDSRDYIADLETFAVDSISSRLLKLTEQDWDQSSGWPGMFLYLKGTASAVEGGGSAKSFSEQDRESIKSKRNGIMDSYSRKMRNTAWLEGKLRLSSTGKARFFSLAAAGFIAGLLFLQILIVNVSARSLGENGVLNAKIRGLVCALACFGIWTMMRQVTLHIDESTFPGTSSYEILFPIIIIILATFSLVLKGIKDQVRQEILATIALASPILAPLVSITFKEKSVELFSDLRTYLATTVLLLFYAAAFYLKDKPKGAAL